MVGTMEFVIIFALFGYIFISSALLYFILFLLLR